MLLAVCLHAHAVIDTALLAPLAGDDPDARIVAVTQIAALVDDDAYYPVSGKIGAAPDDAEGISVNNRLRGVVQAALSGLKLFSDKHDARLMAAHELLKGADPAQIPLINKALEKEGDAEIRQILLQVVATANWQSPDAALRRAAVQTLVGTNNASLKPALEQMLLKNPDGSYSEPDEAVRTEVVRTLAALNRHLTITEFVGKFFYGISLGSVLLLAALGLAITFGLMGIINMAQWGRSYNLMTFGFAGVLGPSRAKPCRAPSSRF